MTRADAKHSSQLAMDAALARIAAAGSESTNRRVLLATDSRIVWLNDFERRIDRQIIGGGMTGARQVFASLASVENTQILRARALVQARIAQLDRYRPGVRAKLARAAELRRFQNNINSRAAA